MRTRRKKPTQVAVIPVRHTDDGRVQVCLIRRKKSAKWGIPKGFIERGDSHAQAALTEAHEEAGLDGRVIGRAIGTYDYEKGPLRLTVAVYVMEVRKERTRWHEMRWRERRWHSLKDASARLRNHRVWALYDRVRPRLVKMAPDARGTAD
jgi:8-oxo-dGTP pyrophosphatase MutT (NUDIX family)